MAIKVTTGNFSSINILTATLSPAAVAANTCAEQALTVQGATTIPTYTTYFGSLDGASAYLYGATLYNPTGVPVGYPYPVNTGIQVGDSITVVGVTAPQFPLMNGTHTVTGIGTFSNPYIKWADASAPQPLYQYLNCTANLHAGNPPYPDDSPAYSSCALPLPTTTGGLPNKTMTVIGIQKPSNQAGLSVNGGYVSNQNTIKVNFCNNTGSPITPTASELYRFVMAQ